jgi:hypothetical protein
MSEIFKPILTWLITSGIKIVGILIGLLILSQMSRWIVKWLERFIPGKTPLQSAEATKRAQTLGNILAIYLEFDLPAAGRDLVIGI